MQLTVKGVVICYSFFPLSDFVWTRLRVWLYNSYI